MIWWRSTTHQDRILQIHFCNVEISKTIQKPATEWFLEECSGNEIRSLNSRINILFKICVLYDKNQVKKIGRPLECRELPDQWTVQSEIDFLLKFQFSRNEHLSARSRVTQKVCRFFFTWFFMSYESGFKGFEIGMTNLCISLPLHSPRTLQVLGTLLNLVCYKSEFGEYGSGNSQIATKWSKRLR